MVRGRKSFSLEPECKIHHSLSSQTFTQMMDTFTDIADPFMGVSEDTGTVLPTHTGLVQGSSSGR